jgi:hypothetical protein
MWTLWKSQFIFISFHFISFLLTLEFLRVSLFVYYIFLIFAVLQIWWTRGKTKAQFARSDEYLCWLSTFGSSYRLQKHFLRRQKQSNDMYYNLFAKISIINKLFHRLESWSFSCTSPMRDTSFPCWYKCRMRYVQKGYLFKMLWHSFKTSIWLSFLFDNEFERLDEKFDVLMKWME